MGIKLTFSPVGESAIFVEIPADYLQSLVTRNQLISDITRGLLISSPEWLIDAVPSFDTLLVNFDGQKIDRYSVVSQLKSLLTPLEDKPLAQAKTEQHKIPVFFGNPSDQHPLDLNEITTHKKITVDRFVSKYCETEYRIYAIGFLPNFAYSGELHVDLSMPRLSSPRRFVPKGAVAIADRQTAVYPENSAGGWRILGYTPSVKQFGAAIRFSVGDTLSFYPISLETYLVTIEQHDD
ncbi:MAG: carboxyltransferase domain-containing protein [Pseudomonadota bacterium]